MKYLRLSLSWVISLLSSSSTVGLRMSFRSKMLPAAKNAGNKEGWGVGTSWSKVAKERKMKKRAHDCIGCTVFVAIVGLFLGNLKESPKMPMSGSDQACVTSRMATGYRSEMFPDTFLKDRRGA